MSRQLRLCQDVFGNAVVMYSAIRCRGTINRDGANGGGVHGED